MSSVHIQDGDESGISAKRAKLIANTSSMSKMTHKTDDLDIDKSFVSVGKRGAEQPCAGHKSKRLRTIDEDNSYDVEPDECRESTSCEEIDMEASDVSVLTESNDVDDFDMVAAGPSYFKGQLNANASYSYRTHVYLSRNQPSFDENSTPNTNIYNCD